MLFNWPDRVLKANETGGTRLPGVVGIVIGRTCGPQQIDNLRVHICSSVLVRLGTSPQVLSPAAGSSLEGQVGDEVLPLRFSR